MCLLISVANAATNTLQIPASQAQIPTLEYSPSVQYGKTIDCFPLADVILGLFLLSACDETM
jgi:hypothetical protein